MMRDHMHRACFVDPEKCIFPDRLAEVEAEARADANKVAVEQAPLIEALREMRGAALGGMARQHLDRSGIFNDPPHGIGKFAECEAPWCKRNQDKLAKWDALLADTAKASEEPQDKPSHRHDWAWGGDGAWDYCTDPDCRATRSHWEDPR
jgi:hypothetical protein